MCQIHHRETEVVHQIHLVATRSTAQLLASADVDKAALGKGRVLLNLLDAVFFPTIDSFSVHRAARHRTEQLLFGDVGLESATAGTGV